MRGDCVMRQLATNHAGTVPVELSRQPRFSERQGNAALGRRKTPNLLEGNELDTRRKGLLSELDSVQQ
jgi:hypothetical protein